MSRPELVLRLALDEREDTVSVRARIYASGFGVIPLRPREKSSSRFVALVLADGVLDLAGVDRGLPCVLFEALRWTESLRRIAAS